ncbi:MAG: hypothetical protein GXP54_01310 [Deltaproteobacteria bacterium]|nr:hypothetical protein [Deltaproteobacteria bacterium]
MAETIDILLLLALPASGKSEVRRYLDSMEPARCRADFHIGPTVQLDDFPYVHLMRRVDQELIARGSAGVFFKGPDRSFADPWDWGTLIHLLNEDYDDMRSRRPINPDSAGRQLMQRLDAASLKAGAKARMERLPGDLFSAVADALEGEAREMLAEKQAGYPDSLDGRTVVMEFARGGADGSTMPLEPPFGYAHSLKMLSPEILERSAILYIWVTPEESRRKNDDRADPDDPGSILHHGVPMEVMLGDYGCDDIEWLLDQSDVPGTVRIEAHGRVYHLPLGRFDNRVDKTSFIRGDVSDWDPSAVAALHEGLKSAMGRLPDLT